MGNFLSFFSNSSLPSLGLAVVLGFSAGVISPIDAESLNDGNKSNSIEDTVDSLNDGRRVSLRDIKNNPVEYEGEIGTVQGGSNSFADFIKSDGYTLPLDCSKFSDYNYASQFKVEVIVELENPGEGDPKLRCLEAPQAVGAYK